MSNFIEFIGQRIKSSMEGSRFFSRNTGPKVVSIIFALVMWLYVMGEVNPQSMIEMANLQVQLLNVEDIEQSGLVIIGQKDFTTNVKVSGRRNDIYKLTSQDIVVRADVRGFQKGVNSIPLEISTPANIALEDVSPKQIKVTLDAIIKRQKPVKVQITGNVAPGYEPGEAVVSPSEVLVQGPESLVNAVDGVLVEVNVEGGNGDILGQLPVKAVNSDGKEVNGVEVKNKYVNVTLPMFAIKEVPISVSLQGKPDENSKVMGVTLDEDLIFIKGPKDIIAGISEIKTENVNIDGLNEPTQIPVGLIIPGGVITGNPDKKVNVSIDIESIKTKEFSFKKDEITIKNLDDSYILELDKMPPIPPGIKVEVEAVESLLDTIKKEDIHLYIDVEDLKAGKYSSDIQYGLSLDVERVIIRPDKIDFEIKDKDKENL